MINLTAWRHTVGNLSRKNAAALLGISRTTLWAYETGRTPIPIAVQQACAWHEARAMLIRISTGRFDPRQLVPEIDALLTKHSA